MANVEGVRQASREQWVGIDAAAELLGVPVVTLRRAIERAARKKPDGAIEARLDGIVARKLGRRWRLWLGTAWTSP